MNLNLELEEASFDDDVESKEQKTCNQDDEHDKLKMALESVMNFMIHGRLMCDEFYDS